MQELDLPTMVGAGGILTVFLFIALMVGQVQIGQRASLRHPILEGQQH
jgi:hypothetical protein